MVSHATESCLRVEQSPAFSLALGAQSPGEQITGPGLQTTGLNEPHLAWLSQCSQLTAVGLSPASLCVDFFFLLVGRRL